jgi:hypothetical protein
MGMMTDSSERGHLVELPTITRNHAKAPINAAPANTTIHRRDKTWLAGSRR